jgi:hypothetical protein
MVKSEGYKKIIGPGPGRPKGSKDKFTSLKESFLEAFKELGGTKALVDWAAKEKNKGEFYKMITKLLPREIKAEVSPKRSIKELTNDQLFTTLLDKKVEDTVVEIGPRKK